MNIGISGFHSHLVLIRIYTYQGEMNQNRNIPVDFSTAVFLPCRNIFASSFTIDRKLYVSKSIRDNVISLPSALSR